MTTTSVLLLNATYQPLTVLSLKRAVSLAFSDKIFQVDDGDLISIKTINGHECIRNIIRLKRYVNAPHRNAKWSRRGVLLRDNHTCIYCGIKVGDTGVSGKLKGKVLTSKNMTIDHIIPRSKNGRTVWSNTACACFRCNQKKADKAAHQMNMPLLWEPTRPRVNYMRISSDNLPQSWRIYLQEA